MPASCTGTPATLTGGLVQEHERALGGWHAEWPSLTGALAYTGGAVSAVGRVLDELEVDSDAMRRNLDLLGGAVMAERISFLLADRLGRREAHELVADAAKRAARNGRSLLDELAADDRVELPPEAFEIDSYLGSAGVFVDQSLGRYREARAAR